MQHFLTSLICFLLFSNPLFCQKKELKTKFGKLSEAEMDMTSYEADPAASAVVLFDKGNLGHRYNESTGFNMIFERHVRFKIFKKDALNYADVIVFHHKDTKVGSIKAACYNMENGKLTVVELEKENIFEEAVTKNFSLTKFIIPGAKEGSIIEYSYSSKSQGGLGMPDEWVFQQESIPTIWSEFEASVPMFIEFKKMSQGWVPFTLAEEGQGRDDLSITLRNRGEGLSNSNSVQKVKLNYNVNKMHFIQENVPALKTEDFVNSPRDYLSSINFDISTIYDTDVVQQGMDWEIVNSTPTNFNRTWRGMGRELLDDVYDKDLTSPKLTEATAKSCTAGKTTTTEKLTAIYEHIGTNYQVQEGYERIFMSQKMESLVKDHKGSATDLNLLFINMLGQAGLKASPVLISTTDHGRAKSFRVSLEEFNRIIAAVEMEDSTLLLIDAAAFPAPVGMLAEEDLAGQGLWLHSTNEIEWVPIQNKIAAKSAVIANFEVDAEGTVSGSVISYEGGYGGIANRRKIKEQGVEQMLKEQFKAWFADGKATEIKVQNAEKWNEATLKSEFKLTSSSFAQVSGDKLYLSPLVGLGIHASPFKNPERKFNVDLGPLMETTYNLSFKLPEGYKVEELPQPTKILLNDGDIGFDYVVENTGGALKVNVRYKQKTSFVQTETYPELQQFFNLMAEKLEAQIVLSKL